MLPGSNIVKLTRDYALVSFRDCFMVIWRHETTLDGARALRRECFAFAETRPRGVALLTIVEEEAPMPPSEARQEIAAFLRDGSERIKASSVVFEGTGFRAAAVRSVVVGLTMLARQKYPHKVFSNLREAAAFLDRELGDTLADSFDARELEDAVAEIRAEISRRPTRSRD